MCRKARKRAKLLHLALVGLNRLHWHRYMCFSTVAAMLQSKKKENRSCDTQRLITSPPPWGLPSLAMELNCSFKKVYLNKQAGTSECVSDIEFIKETGRNQTGCIKASWNWSQTQIVQKVSKNKLNCSDCQSLERVHTKKMQNCYLPHGCNLDWNPEWRATKNSIIKNG